MDSIPSSGTMVKVKLRRSAGSGKVVFIVDGKSSSVRSVFPGQYKRLLGPHIVIIKYAYLSALGSVLHWSLVASWLPRPHSSSYSISSFYGSLVYTAEGTTKFSTCLDHVVLSPWVKWSVVAMEKSCVLELSELPVPPRGITVY